MVMSQDPSVTASRNAFLREYVPELSVGSTRDVLNVDAYRTANQQTPSRLSTAMMHIAATIGDIRDMTTPPGPPEVRGSIPRPESGERPRGGVSTRILRGEEAERTMLEQRRQHDRDDIGLGDALGGIFDFGRRSVTSVTPGGLAGRIGGFAGQSIASIAREALTGGDPLAEARARGERVFGGVLTALEDMDRPRGAVMGLIDEGLPGLVGGVKSPELYLGRDLPGIRGINDDDILGPLSWRDIVGGGADIIADPVDLAFGGGVAGDVARLGRRTVRSLDNAALRAAEGPLESSTLGALTRHPLPPELPNLRDEWFRQIDADPRAALTNDLPMARTNREALENARTGQPLSLFGFRSETGPRRQDTGIFYAADPTLAGVYALRRGITPTGDHILFGGARDALTVNRLDFRNPVIIDGGHEQAVRDLGDDDTLDLWRAARSATGARSEDLYAQLDRSIADDFAFEGYDAIIYRHPTEVRQGVWTANDTEIVDLRPVQAHSPGSVQTLFDRPPNRPIAGGATAPPPPVRDIIDEIVPGEDIGLGALRRYEGRVNTQGLEIRRDLEAGNRMLQDLGVGHRTARSLAVNRDADMEDLFRALHGETTPPPRLQAVFDELQRLVDIETRATLDFDPKFMAHPDYFPRGWREVEVSPPGSIRQRMQNAGAGSMGARPGFAKPRVDASFSDILSNTYTRPDGSTYRLEPVSWNPFEMIALRRVAGAEFREQTEMINFMRQRGIAVPVDGPVPEGYRVPRVGPAFEGKPRIFPDADGGAPRFGGYTSRYAVPDKIADVLENMYDAPMRLALGNKNLLTGIRALSRGTKRAKLIGSLFQHVDFATRSGFSAFGGAIDALAAGRPIRAVQNLIELPVTIGQLAFASTSAARRRALREQILSTAPIVKDRPGISLRGISEAGWTQSDISFLRRDVRETLNDAIQSNPNASPNMIRRAQRRAQRIEQAWQDGLFDGVYPQAQITALKNHIVPRLVRQHPDWTDEQIMGEAAQMVNLAFSSLGNFQTVFKNRGMRELLHNLLFSTNEAEGLIRSAMGTVKGGNKALWAEFYMGGALFLALVANAVHMAATGEPLPMERYNPIRMRNPEFESFPVPIRYNTDFMSPNVPLLEGRHGTELTIDLVGQMDTALRALDPVSFVSNRFSVPVRAGVNQARGADFYGRPIEGVQERAAQLASDLFSPIGAGNLLEMAGVGPENEGRLGAGGMAAQLTGANLSAETTPDLLDRYAQQDYGKPYADLEPFERREMEENNPELAAELEQRRQTSAERQSEGAQRGIVADEVRAEYRAQQENDDALLESGQISAQEWRSRERMRNAQVSAALDVLYRDIPERDPQNIRDQYYAEIQKRRDASGQISPEGWDEIDAWRGQLTDEQNAEIDRNTGLTSTPTQQRRREVAAQLEETGYFDIRDRVWERVAERTGFDEYATAQQFENELRSRIRDRLVERGVTSRAAQTILTDRIIDDIEVLKVWSQVSNDVEEAWILANAELATEAVEMGYLGNLRADEEQAILTAAGAR